MNRRSLLALIGFAPIATAAAALPRVADPAKLASTGGREVSAKVPFVFNDGVLCLDEVHCGVVTISPEYKEMLQAMDAKMKWLSETQSFTNAEIERLNMFIGTAK